MLYTNLFSLSFIYRNKGEVMTINFPEADIIWDIICFKPEINAMLISEEKKIFTPVIREEQKYCYKKQVVLIKYCIPL